ncbi:hypothetical protein QFZ53_003019 [Microbacterium natoriense]|uniref:Uncharacterized protein n=1 Tax=Microbacterium natoriense TaxID=284570 RepID=A0AAW8EZ76_9MICO|nr:hypothetical protein [Microbacterium natoriense]MDQ0648823.1 hypothetical protein [Microbacterium natoriense]
MSDAEEWIDDLKPTGDLAEQRRPVIDEPDDPERAVSLEPVSALTEADEADVADQREEVPFDDEPTSSEEGAGVGVLASDDEGFLEQ